MTTAEKKKIINSHKVKGELKIRDSFGKIHIMPFKDVSSRGLSEYLNLGYNIPKASGYETQHNIFEFYLSPENKGLEIWVPGPIGNYLTHVTPWKHVEILWAHYPKQVN